MSKLDADLLTILPVLFVLLLGVGILMGYWVVPRQVSPTTEFTKILGRIEIFHLKEPSRRSGASLIFLVNGVEYRASSDCAERVLKTGLFLEGRTASFQVAANGYAASIKQPYPVFSFAVDSVAVCTLTNELAMRRASDRWMGLIAIGMLCSALWCLRKWRRLNSIANEDLYERYPGLKK